MSWVYVVRGLHASAVKVQARGHPDQELGDTFCWGVDVGL